MTTLLTFTQTDMDALIVLGWVSFWVLLIFCVVPALWENVIPWIGGLINAAKRRVERGG